jgi:hypothetical protein
VPIGKSKNLKESLSRDHDVTAVKVAAPARRVERRSGRGGMRLEIALLFLKCVLLIVRYYTLKAGDRLGRCRSVKESEEGLTDLYCFDLYVWLGWC